MIVTVVGKQRKQGIYEGNDYDNTYLHCLCDDFLGDDFEGVQCSIIKLKTKQVPIDLKIKDKVSVEYNAFGKVLGLSVIARKE